MRWGRQSCAWVLACALAGLPSAWAQTRVLSYSYSAQAVVIEHEGQMLVLDAAQRKPMLDLVVERVDQQGVEMRFTGLPANDVIAKVGRGADLVELRKRLRAQQTKAQQPEPSPEVTLPALQEAAAATEQPR